MARPSRTLLWLAPLALAAVLLASCGDEDAKLLPGGTAREIEANLTAVQELADEGDCVGAESAAQQVSEQVESVEGVDPSLKEALRKGATRLEEVVANCEEGEEEEEATTTEPTENEEKSREKEEKEREKEEADREKEEEKREKEEEKAQREAEREEEPPSEGEQTLPPQANGEAKGREGGPAPPAEGPSSGGVAPGSEVGGEG